jgi:hypothetical protein
LFDGLHSAYGASEPDWITGLAPSYLARLPADPRHDGRPDHQYLYASDGVDYKLISYGAEDLEMMTKLRPNLVDPNNTCEAYGFWTPGAATWFPDPDHAVKTNERLRDLAALAGMLDAYRKKYGGYPVSEGFDGLHTRWGRSAEDWIRGLTPEFAKALPRDPRRNDDPANQYFYKSNGRDYRLIAHHPEDCRLIKRELPGLIDPVRDCQAYGVWTDGGRDW